MKKNRFFHIIIWLYFCVIFSISQIQSVSAQENTYYYGDEKVILTTDSSSLIVFFKQEFAHLNTHTTFTDFRIIKSVLPDYDFEDTSTAILYTTEIIHSIPDFLISQGVQINMLKGFSYGYRVSQVGIIFPSLEVAFRLNEERSINSSPIIDLLSKYDAVFIDNAYGIYYYEVTCVQDAFDLSNELFELGYSLWSEPIFYTEAFSNSDPLYPWQYYLNNNGQNIDGVFGTPDIDIDTPEAWEISKGSSTIKVAVIDPTGVEDHPDIRDSQGNSRVKDGHTSNCIFGCNGSPKIDTDSHGNAVAGIIAASHNNIGIKGIAPNVQIIPIYLRQTNNMKKDARAIGKAWDELNADVLCIAMSYPGKHNVIDDAIQIARENGRNGKGAIVIASSGNTFGNVAFPGSVNGVITVGAIDLNGVIHDYSGRGPEVDLVAPSGSYVKGQGDVRTTDRVAPNGENPNGNYINTFGGTSAAAPQVAGVVALMLSVNPDLTEWEVYCRLIMTATDLGPPGKDDYYGYGLVNAYRAIAFDNLHLENKTFGGVQKFTAANTVTIGPSVVFENTEPWLSNIEVVAGQKIVAKPGSKSEQGSYFHAYASDQGPCGFGPKSTGANNKQPYYQNVDNNEFKIDTVEYSSDCYFIAFPNPFENIIEFAFFISNYEQVKISLYDVFGNCVTEIINKEMPKGRHSVIYNDSSLSTGLYFCIMETKTDRKVVKVVKLE